MILALFGALAIGLCLGLLGSGGSILTVPVLVYLVGHAEKQSIAESLVIVGTIALAGAVRNWTLKRVDLRAVLFFGLPGMAGALVGAYITKSLRGAVLLVMLAVVMLVAAALMAKPRKKQPGALPPAPRSNLQTALVLIPAGFVVGILPGLLGVGGGFLIVPSLVLLARLNMHTAIGTSLTIIAMFAAAGFFQHQSALVEIGESVDWRIVCIFAAIGVLGSFIGTSVASKLNQQLLKRIFAVFIVIMAIYILIREAPAVLNHHDTPSAQTMETPATSHDS